MLTLVVPRSQEVEQRNFDSHALRGLSYSCRDMVLTCLEIFERTYVAYPSLFLRIDECFVRF